MVDSTPSSESRLICYDNHIRDDESSEEPTTPAGKFRATGGSTLQAAQFVHEHPESAAAGVLTIPRLKFSAMLVELLNLVHYYIPLRV